MLSLRPYQQTLVSNVLAALRRGDGETLVISPTGCLTGDTIININRAGKGGKVRLDSLYLNHNGRGSKIFDPAIKTMVRSFTGKKIELHEVEDVVYSGVKQVFCVRLENGHSIKATACHLFLTRKGWIRADGLIGHEVMCDNHKPVASSFRKKEIFYRNTQGVRHHPHCSLKDSGIFRIETHRLVYEASINQMSFDEYVNILRCDEAASLNLKFVNPETHHIHHIDGDKHNNDRSNLVCLTGLDHKYIHASDNKDNFNQGEPSYSRVIAVESVGLEDTYDICCKHPHHNFVANGMVVHNSGKTICFIRISEELIGTAVNDEVVLILSHLSLLTDQTKKKFNKFSGLPVGILQASKVPGADDRIVISTMQSSRDFAKIAHYYDVSKKKVRYIIIDESHFRWSKSYQEILNTFPDAQVIDFTATPFKNKKLAVNGYDSVAFQISLQELIDQKYLVPPTLKQMVIDDDTPEKRCALLLRTYSEFEYGKKAIMFMRNKDECKLLCDALTQANIKAAVVTDDVKGVKRDAIFTGYDGTEYDVLISVNVLTAGFDSLLCESVFMFGTESPTVYLQRVGRALRPIDGDSVKPHHSKLDARIYVFGDTPTIQSGVIEKHHNQALRPKKFEECKSLDEQVEWLEDMGLEDTPEYQFSKAAHKVQKIAKKINMQTLLRMIENKTIGAEYMLRLAGNADDFRPIQGGNSPASKAQRQAMIKAGVNPPPQMTSNEASFIINSLTGNNVNHHQSQRFVVTEGRYKGSHVKDLPWAYKSAILKKFPQSNLAVVIKTYHHLK
jgi:superfamily II DNA or RNA helicase